jgi:hypothetical protein
MEILELHATQPPEPALPDNGHTSSGHSPRRWSPRRRKVIAAAMAIALVATALLTIGTVADIRSFDRTSGGYDYPYAGVTGDPLDWGAMEQTEDGFHQDGHVIDMDYNCRTGMITWNVGPFSRDFRTFSERAIVVHRPQDTCQARGFDTSSWAISDLLN